MKCPQCSAQLEYSPVDDADWCWSCGSLFYKFTPDNTVSRRRAVYSRHEARSLVPEQIRDLFVKAGGRLHVRDLSDQMRALHGTNGRYVRLVLTSRVEFESIGRGWWLLEDGQC